MITIPIDDIRRKKYSENTVKIKIVVKKNREMIDEIIPITKPRTLPRPVKNLINITPGARKQ